MSSRTPLTIALSTALLAGCPLNPGGNTGGNSGTPIGTPPTDLAEVCAADSITGVIRTLLDVDYLALRHTYPFGESTNEDLDIQGVPCDGASDPIQCQSDLDALETEAGWGYCGEGCVHIGLVYTAGDTVGLADEPSEYQAVLGDTDTAGNALFRAVSEGFTPDCDTMVETASGYQLTAQHVTNDCPWTDEGVLLDISTDGAVTINQVLWVDETDGCAGRRPDGLCPPQVDAEHALGQHLAHAAHLEGAAVMAFEHLIQDLIALNAPAELIERAESARADEVRHAHQMSELATAHGASTPAVQAEPYTSRSAMDIALENATEGCVREAYGVVDAAYRALHAPTQALRDLYDTIANDEARHAQLSWDIAHWLEPQLTEAQRQILVNARQQAHMELCEQLLHSQRASQVQHLGAPTPRTAAHMAQVLYAQLAA